MNPQPKPSTKPAAAKPIVKRRRRKSKIILRNLNGVGSAIPTTHTSIRLADDDKRKLEALAHAMHGGITKSAVVRLLVRTAYDKLILKQKPQSASNEEIQ